MFVSTIKSEKEEFTKTRAYKIFKGVTAGALGGVNITLVGHPFDTLKVRLQTQPQHPPLYNGLIDCFKKTIKMEGVKGLYAGMTSPLIGQMLFRATLFLSHSETKRYLSDDGQSALKPYHLFLAGSVGWGVGSIIECPFDVIKSQLQVQMMNKNEGIIKRRFATMGDCAAVIYRTNGITGLYHGYFAHLLRNIPAGALHLGIYDLIRINWAKRDGIHTSQLRMYQDMIAGSIAGVIFWSAVYPFDVVKSTLQSDAIVKSERHYKGTWDCFRKLYADGGLRSFYRGLTPCVLRAIPANAVMLYTVARIQDHF